MSTRSQIAVTMPGGLIRSVYCHSDGYPSWNGRYLMNHWHSHGRAMMVTSLGDLSSLGKVLGKKHDFDWRTKLHDQVRVKMGQLGVTYSDDRYYEVHEEVEAAIVAESYPMKSEDWCLAYHRDRGDTSVSEFGGTFTTIAEYAEHARNFAYGYLWRHETWWMLTDPVEPDDEWAERDPARPGHEWAALSGVLARCPAMADHKVVPWPSPCLRKRSTRLWDAEATADPATPPMRTAGRRATMI